MLSRYHAVEGWPGTPAVEKTSWQLAERHTPAVRTADYTQAIMDLGATLCTRSRPACETCPQRTECQAHAAGTQKHYPSPKARKSLPVRSATLLMVRDEAGELLLEQRPPAGIWGGLWSLPELPPESTSEAWGRAHRLAIREQRNHPPFRHTFSHFHLDISPLELRVCEQAGNTIMEPTRLVWARLQVAPRDLTQYANDTIGPRVSISGVATWGRSTNFPVILDEVTTQGAYTLSWQKGAHFFKVGGDVTHIAATSSFPVSFAGSFTFGSLAAFVAGTPTNFTQGFGNPVIDLPDTLYGVFAQDSWTVSDRLTLVYGLRYDYDAQPQDIPRDRSNPIEAPLDDGINRDGNNVSPRAGFTWDPIGGGRTLGERCSTPPLWPLRLPTASFTTRRSLSLEEVAIEEKQNRKT